MDRARIRHVACEQIHCHRTAVGGALQLTGLRIKGRREPCVEPLRPMSPKLSIGVLVWVERDEVTVPCAVQNPRFLAVGPVSEPVGPEAEDTRQSPTSPCRGRGSTAYRP